MKLNRANRVIFFLVISTIVLSFTYIVTGADLQQKKKDPWNLPKDADSLSNPTKGNKNFAAEGKKLFLQSCASCHGTEGLGDGPGSVSLNPKPKNLTTKEVQKQSDGVIFSKISNGDGGAMVPWKFSLSEKQRWYLVDYVRELGHKSK